MHACTHKQAARSSRQALKTHQKSRLLSIYPTHHKSRHSRQQTQTQIQASKPCPTPQVPSTAQHMSTFPPATYSPRPTAPSTPSGPRGAGALREPEHLSALRARGAPFYSQPASPSIDERKEPQDYNTRLSRSPTQPNLAHAYRQHHEAAYHVQRNPYSPNQRRTSYMGCCDAQRIIASPAQLPDRRTDHTQPGHPRHRQALGLEKEWRGGGWGFWMLK
ncbi:hypothetical protein BU26DRAFT_240582 [Trematosphaeria pertusa]|uniref:Uncharacterized protein n=1 Tax=Trematosphaeria pertusa TaxID=390896 RepID=A0A6A6INF6_9PLEO|nr:uncharacterized protein BU26DRAFT_240582 [Trematosphaeria pertusa]KAF2251628.1 hypothetical protein BU26DRAFT_240582 [Trematosphaeria pertusa]